MAIQITGQVGVQNVADGAYSNVRQGRNAEVVVQELHGRFYEQAFRGNTYSGGIGLTAINNVTYTTGTLGATVTPIIGLYNPIGSLFNAVILQASLGLTVTAATSTGGGPFVWATAITTAVITTGSAPLNRKSLQPAGSVMKDLSNVAPTGLTPNLAVRFGSSLGGGSLASFSFVGTAVGQVTPAFTSVENFDGSLIVPPGGVLALLATTTPVAHSAASSIMWEEVAI